MKSWPSQADVGMLERFTQQSLYKTDSFKKLQ